MNEDISRKLINDIVKPWNEFNQILSKPYAVEPELSDFTFRVNNLATSLSHFPEQLGQKRASTCLWNDIADTAKHGNLKDKKRITRTSISSCFLCNDADEFCFIRNIPYITYKNAQFDEVDFMKESLSEINNLLSQNYLKLQEELKILESETQTFKKEACLKYDETYCIHMKSTSLRFFRKDVKGSLIPYDPPVTNLSIY